MRFPELDSLKVESASGLNSVCGFVEIESFLVAGRSYEYRKRDTIVGPLSADSDGVCRSLQQYARRPLAVAGVVMWTAHRT